MNVNSLRMNVDPEDEGEQNGSYPRAGDVCPSAGERGSTLDERISVGRIVQARPDRVVYLTAIGQELAEPIHGNSLYVACRDPSPTRTFSLILRDQRLGDIVPVPPIALAAMGRDHAMSLTIEEQAGQEAGTAVPDAIAALDRVIRQLILHFGP